MVLTSLYRSCVNEVRYVFYNLRSRHFQGLDAKTSLEAKLVSEIKDSSCVVLENYWTKEYAADIKGKLAEFHDSGEPYVLGDHTRDEVVRIYHVERLLPELREFRFDPFITSVANAYNGFSSYSGALVYQHDTIYGREKSHYHVDSFVRQFKAMMYLDDVDMSNGPFSYIPGSQKLRRRYFKKQLRGRPGQKENVFNTADIDDLLDKEVAVCAPAGSLLMFDATCIHRGAPQTESDRSVLMNYIMPSAGDIYLNKNLP